MWSFIKRNWWRLLLFFIIFVGLIPLGLNIAFKIDGGIECLRAEWAAGDALGFYGCIIAACLAIYGVYLTIDFTQASAREDKRLSVIPYFSVSFLDTEAHYTIDRFNSITEKKNKGQKADYYTEYELKDCTFVIENGKIQPMKLLSDTQKELIQRGGFRDETIAKGTIACVCVPMVYLPMKLTNVGNGAAISVRMGFCRKDCKQEDRKYIKPVPIVKEDMMFARIFSEDCSQNSKSLGEYLFEIVYCDIYGTKYVQEHDIEILYDNSKKLPMCRVNTIHEQRIVSPGI